MSTDYKNKQLQKAFEIAVNDILSHDAPLAGTSKQGYSQQEKDRAILKVAKSLLKNHDTHVHALYVDPNPEIVAFLTPPEPQFRRATIEVFCSTEHMYGSHNPYVTRAYCDSCYDSEEEKTHYKVALFGTEPNKAVEWLIYNCKQRCDAVMSMIEDAFTGSGKVTINEDSIEHWRSLTLQTNTTDNYLKQELNGKG